MLFSVRLKNDEIDERREPAAAPRDKNKAKLLRRPFVDGDEANLAFSIAPPRNVFPPCLFIRCSSSSTAIGRAGAGETQNGLIDAAI